MTPEQQKALALARARRRRQDAAQAANTPEGAESQQSKDIRSELSSMTQNPETTRYDIPYGAGMNWTDAATGGLASKGASALNAAIRAPFTDKTFGQEYDEILGSVKDARERYQRENPRSAVASAIGGGVIGGGKLMGAASNLASRALPNVANRLNQGIVGRTLTDILGGAGFGAVSGYGYDDGVLKGAAIGGGLGAVTRPLLAAVGSLSNSIGGLMGLGNQGRAQTAIADAVSRSGRSAQDISDELARAAAAGQPEYMVADAMGNAGQRMLTGVARSPGDMRQTIAETLQARQAGQADRLVNAVSEGFNAPQTAAQARDAMTASRTATANANYGAARRAAGTVDPTGAIQAADNFLGTAGSISRTNIADDTVEGAVRRARSFLTDGQNIVNDFDTAFRAKVELDSMIENARPTVQRELIPIRNALDDALALASDLYAGARDTFRQQSQAINAIDQGTAASSSRVRAGDSIPEFQAMNAEQQAAFRTGYADPIIGRLEAASTSPTTNKARQLLTTKTAQEFPAFAAPGQGPQLGERIAREQTMFETANAALGGSRTADNLSDIADVGGFDPTMIGALASGNIKSAALQALTRSANALSGRNTQTRDLIAQALMETAPTRANAQLLQAVQRGENLSRIQQQLIRALITGGTSNAIAN